MQASDFAPFPERPALNRAEVDGVPAFWHPAPGPFRASLMFRVGQSDEPLTHRGICHLVEHLALHELAERDYPLNGFVDGYRTAFYASGTEDEVASFLTDVTAALSDLHCDRVDAERGVLEVEANSRGGGIGDLMLGWRFGATGIGKVAYREFGLRWLGEDELQDWAARHFTRGNAALWLTGPPPAGLGLTLPEGPLVAPQWPEQAEGVETPGRMPGPDASVGFSVITGRGARAGALARILERRLQSTLRRDHALSYHVGMAVERVSSEELHAVLAADVLPERAHEAVELGIRQVEDLAERGPAPEEVHRDIQLTLRHLGGEEAVFGWLDDAVNRHLFGRDDYARSPKEDVEALLAATADELATVVAPWVESMVVAMPEHAEPLAWRFQPEPWCAAAVSGRTFTLADARTAETLVVGPEGASIVREDGKFVTVKFDALGAMPSWSDSKRVLIGRNGFNITVAAPLWKDGFEAIRLIDAAVPQSLRVDMGADESGVEPLAQASPSPPQPLIGNRVLRWAAWILGVLMLLVVVVMPFTAPSVDPSDVEGVGADALVVRADGTVDCGVGTSLEAVLADWAPPTGDGSAETAKRLVDACRNDARWTSGMGAVGLLIAVALAVSRWRRSRG